MRDGGVKDRKMRAVLEPLFSKLYTRFADREKGRVWQGNFELFLEGRPCWCSGESPPYTCRERPVTRLVSLLNGENGRLWFEEFQRFMDGKPCWEPVKPPKATVTDLASKRVRT